MIKNIHSVRITVLRCKKKLIATGGVADRHEPARNSAIQHIITGSKAIHESCSVSKAI